MIIISWRLILIGVIFFMVLSYNIGRAEDLNDTKETQVALAPEPQVVPILMRTQDDVFKQRISLDLRNIDILEALKFLSTKVGINIVTTKAVTGRVALTVEDALFKDVFDIMLRSNGLAYARQGDIYNVMTEAEYKAFYGDTFLDTRLVKIFHLQYAIPDQAFSLLDALKSTIGRVLVDPESGNVLAMDTPEKLKQMRLALDEFEKESTVGIVTLKYAKAKEMEDILKTQLDAKKVGSIKADERNNQVIIQAFPDRMKQIGQLIRSLDKQTKQVLIDAKIVKVKLSNQLDSGLEWEGIFRFSSKFGTTYGGSSPFSPIQKSTADWVSRKQFLDDTMNNSIGAYPFSGNTSDVSSSIKTTLGEKMHFGVINDKRDIDLLFKYIETLGQTRVLSNPKISVVNNQEAKIHVGERQAYVTTTTSTGQTSNTISEEVTFVDVGIQLAVTPTINDDGYIIMKIKPEVSSVSSTLVTPTGNKIPIMDTSLTETTVMMKNDTTLIIGGLRKDEKVKSGQQFPWLAKIPFIGYPFRTTTDTTERTELLVLITPHIISGTALATGNDRNLTQSPGKEYQEYDQIKPDYADESLEKEVVSGELPAEVGPKSYREEALEDKPEIPFKDMRYEPLR